MTELTRLPERNLDVLRTVAVSCVLADHIGLVFSPPAASRVIWAQLGHAGVLLFFVHTSLVLMASLERQGQGNHWIRTFYVRRAFRIYPLAIATVIIARVFSMPVMIPRLGIHIANHHMSAVRVVANLLLVQNLAATGNVLGPFWSLPLEVDMYFVLPLCFLIARRSSRDMVALAAFMLLAYFVTAGGRIPGLWRFDVFNYTLCFFGGILAYHLLRGGARPKVPSWTIYPALLVAVALLPLMHATNATHLRNFIPCLLLGAALPYIAELGESFVTRGAHTIAKYSYGVYLLHVPVLWFAFDVLGESALVLQILIAAGGLVIAPFAAYHLIERPGIELGKRLTHRRIDTLAAVQPAP